MNDGKKLEDIVHRALRRVMTSTPAFVHRFADSKAARNLVPAAPADFLWATPYGVYLIECKSTSKHEPLKALLDPDQIGKHRLWHRAGHPSRFFYADLPDGRLEVWDGRNVVKLYLARGAAVSPAWSGEMGDIDEMIEVLAVHKPQGAARE